MQTKISFYFIVVLVVLSLVEADPQVFNNYPFRPTFSDLDPVYNYYTTPMPYSQNMVRIWPYILDQAVSPLYNLNQGSGYLTNTNNGYGQTLNNGYNTYPNTATGTVYNPNGYLQNSNIYSNPAIGYTTMPPYLSNTNPFGIYNGKK